MKAKNFVPSLLATVIGLHAYVAAGGSPSNEVNKSFDCPVTIGVGSRGQYENSALRTSLWPDGKVIFKPDGPGRKYENGALGMKWGWIRLEKGQLIIKGRRLDAEAPPLGSVISNDYGDTGFQAGGLIFPTPGCWEVTGMLGDSSLTFVTLVVLEGSL